MRERQTHSIRYVGESRAGFKMKLFWVMCREMCLTQNKTELCCTQSRILKKSVKSVLHFDKWTARESGIPMEYQNK